MVIRGCSCTQHNIRTAGIFVISKMNSVVLTTEFKRKYAEIPRRPRDFHDFRGESLIFRKLARVLWYGRVFLKFRFQFTLLKQRNSGANMLKRPAACGIFPIFAGIL